MAWRPWRSKACAWKSPRWRPRPEFQPLADGAARRVRAIGQYTGAGQAFRRYNARLDRDKPD
ncbi:hypothetical protein EMIT051CA3_90228 [Pseudomonas chlororaphis]